MESCKVEFYLGFRRFTSEQLLARDVILKYDRSIVYIYRIDRIYRIDSAHAMLCRMRGPRLHPNLLHRGMKKDG